MKGFSKYQEGQEISAYTKKNEIFEGYIKSKDDIKYVVNSEGKAKKLSELTHVKRIGRILEDDYKQKIATYLQQFDMDAVSKDIDKLVKPMSDQLRQADDELAKAKPDEIEAELKNQTLTQSVEQGIENGTIKKDDALEQYKKDISDIEKETKDKDASEQLSEINIKNIPPEKLFDNKIIQKAILKEIEIKTAEDAGYQQPEEEYGMDDDRRDDASEDCFNMYEHGISKDAIINHLQVEYEISKDEAEDMYNDLTQDDLEWEYDENVPEEDDEFDLYGITYSDLSNEVDDEIEKELDSLSLDDIGFGDALIEHLSNKFGGDAQKAIKETNCTEDAVLNLAEQIKVGRVNEIRNKHR